MGSVGTPGDQLDSEHVTREGAGPTRFGDLGPKQPDYTFLRAITWTTDPMPVW